MTDNMNDDLTSLVDALGVSVTDIPVPEGVWEAALDAAFSAPEGAAGSSTVPEMDDEPDVPADDSDDEIIVDDDSDDTDGPDDIGQTDTSHHHGDATADADDGVTLDDDPTAGSHETATYHHDIYEHDTDHDTGHTDI